VLTNRPAEWSSASWSLAPIGAAMLLSVVTVTSARAGSVINLSCVGAGSGLNCVAQVATAGDPYIRVVPEALGEVQKAQVAARDRKWVARCHPVAERDAYGVARYHYSAPGCEFGLGAE
jgi:hypothetical protein